MITGADHVGVTFASLPHLGPAGAPAVARQAADLGYGSFWVAETVGAEAFSLLAAAGAAAPGLGLGTGVVALQLRTPMVAAMAAATLQALHPEVDILLGVGTSSPAVVERWHGAALGDHPLAQVREYLALVRACLSGEKVDFDGDHYHCRGFRLGVRLGERKPKVVLGALGPKMLTLGGELADGVLLNYLPASHVSWSVEQVRKGGGATVYGYVHVGVGDRGAALSPAKKDIFSYAVAPAYAASFSRAGHGDSVAEVLERHRAGDRDGAVSAVSNELAESIDVVGDADLVRSTVQAYVDAGVQVPVVMALPWGPDRAAVLRDTLEAVAR